MYEILKHINDNTKLALKDNELYLLKQIHPSEIEMYKKLIGIDNVNIIKLYEITLIDDRFYIVEEFFKGRTLAEYIKTNGVLDNQQVKSVAVQICDGLADVHRLGIIHRDISPNNIMVDDNLNVRIIDFGISRLVKKEQRTDTQILGTQGFAAPEQYGFIQTDDKADIYSIGVLINYMKTGKIPNEIITNGVFLEIVNKCTQIDKNNRYDNVIELKKAILKKASISSFIKKVPGFRTGSKLHMIIASIYYLNWLLFELAFTSTSNNLISIVCNIFSPFFTFLLPALIICEYNNWIDKSNKLANRPKAIKTFVKILLATISVCIGMAFIVLDNEI